MIERLNIGDNTIAYDMTGEGPLRRPRERYRRQPALLPLHRPTLAAAGYRVANVDIRGCGGLQPRLDGYAAPTSPATWSPSFATSATAGRDHRPVDQRRRRDHSPPPRADLISGLIELGTVHPRTVVPPRGLLRIKRYRSGTMHLTATLLMGSLPSWKKYLDLAYPTKPSDWDTESARIDAKLSEPGRMKALQAMCKSKPSDAGAQLEHVRCPVLVIEGSADPTGLTHAPRASRSSTTCPTVSVSWLS